MKSLILRLWKIYLARMVFFRAFFMRMLVGKMGNGVMPYAWPKLYAPEKIEIGNNVTINHGVLIDGRGGVKIGNLVRLSPYSVIETGFLHKTGNPRKHDEAPVVIEDNVWVASGAKVLAGVTIGENSIIAAGAIVTKDLPANHIARGVPAVCYPISE